MGVMSRRHFLRSGTVAAGALGAAVAAPAASDIVTTDDDMSWEELAAMDFVAWDKDILSTLPDRKEWHNRMVTVRVAAQILTRTKPELIETMSDLDKQLTADGDESLAVHMMGGLDGTRDVLRGLLAIVDMAFARCACAAMSEPA